MSTQKKLVMTEKIAVPAAIDEVLSDFNGREGAFTELDVYQALARARTQVKDIPDNQSLGAFSLMPDPHEGAICATGWRMVC